MPTDPATQTPGPLQNAEPGHFNLPKSFPIVCWPHRSRGERGYRTDAVLPVGCRQPVLLQVSEHVHFANQGRKRAGYGMPSWQSTCQPDQFTLAVAVRCDTIAVETQLLQHAKRG